MKAVLFVAALLCLSVQARPFPTFGHGVNGNGTNYAVLVAGSNGYYNYRHQADVYHAYQILKANGYPDDNIIVFHYDDIAENKQNPDKGVVINRPGGPNNYDNVPKTYVGKDVTPANFLAVLTGDAAKATGPVLKSGPNDHVFINFVDHGAVGLIAFPSEYLYAKALLEALTTMHDKKMYGQLVFYLEACESGSMFQGTLPADIQIFATTAANAAESSYACYYDSHLSTYLGDLYSVSWMEDTDATGLSESLETQFLTVRTATNLSHVMQYGDLSFNSEAIGQFQGFGNSDNAVRIPKYTGPVITVDSRDVQLDILQRRLAAARASNSDQVELLSMQVDAEVARRQKVDLDVYRVAAAFFSGDDLTTVLETKKVPADFDCYAESLDAFNGACGRLEDYGLKFASVFANLCNAGISSSAIQVAARQTCLA